MQNGLAIIEKTDTTTKGFFIDQDTIEFARLNANTKKHIAQAEAEQRKVNHSRNKAEKAEAKRKAYNRNSAVYVLMRLATIGVMALAGTAGMIHPAICIPVALFCLCTACVRLGAWLGRAAK